MKDAKGKVVGTTTESATAGSGTATVLIDLAKQQAAPGTFTVTWSALRGLRPRLPRQRLGPGPDGGHPTSPS